MPFFGVDDVLLLLASTSALLWVKRGDILQDSLPGLSERSRLSSADSDDTLTGHDDAHDTDAPRTVMERRLCANPRLLLRGFDLLAAQRGKLAQHLRSGGDLHSLLSKHDGESSSTLTTSTVDEQANGLVRDSLVSTFAETPLIPYRVPNVPHRHYNPAKRLPPVTELATSTEEEVSRLIRRYSLAEVHALFATMEAEHLWESVLSVSRGIESAGAQLTYLTQRNVEAALRTLCEASRADMALAYYLAYGVDMLPADPLVVALLDACRHMNKVAAQVLAALVPFQARWSPAVYACCLTTAARTDLPLALQLYDAYEKRLARAALDAARRRQQTTDHPRRTSALSRVFASPSLLWRAGGLASPPAAEIVESPSVASSSENRPGANSDAQKLQNLYHVIIPLTMEQQPARALRYVQDMMAREPESAPDVFLKSLWTAEGRRLASLYLSHVRAGNLDGDKGKLPSVRDSWLSQSELRGLYSPQASAAETTPVSDLAFGLFQCNPSAMNMNTLLRLITSAPTEAPKPGASGTETPAGPSVRTHQLPYDPALAHIARHGSPRLTIFFEQVPLPAGDVDAGILARALTEGQTQWALAVQFLEAMVRRKRFPVVPPLAAYLARLGQWDAVSRNMSVYLSNQRSSITAAEVRLCVEASVHSGRWSSALFWVARANSKGLVLSPDVYEQALSVSSHCRWEVSARVLQSIREAGGTCSERAVLHVLEAAANQGMFANALQTFSRAGGGITWKP